VKDGTKHRSLNFVDGSKHMGAVDRLSLTRTVIPQLSKEIVSSGKFHNQSSLNLSEQLTCCRLRLIMYNNVIFLFCLPTNS